MDNKHLKRSAFLALIALLLTAVTLTTATYAWFTSNRLVGTSAAEARTGEEEVSLLLSQTGGDAFDGHAEVDLVQVNSAALEKLMPVSTADLATFVTDAAYLDGYASAFRVVEDEAFYYHARIYVKATANSPDAGSRMALYFDADTAAGGALAVNDESGQLLNAARLGLTFDGADPVIFTLSDTNNAPGETAFNTRLDGTVLSAGKVLTAAGGKITAADDPARPIAECTIAEGLVGEPITELELGRIYTLDVYFYLEGCDGDCTDSISFDGSDLHLAFYGVLL